MTIDACLAQSGLDEHVRLRPGLRIPGAFDSAELIAHLAPDAAGAVKPTATREELLRVEGIDETVAATILMRALHWPDAFPGDEPVAERWRPWRSYAALHLGLV